MMSVALFHYPGDQYRAFQYRVDIVCERRYVFHEMRRKSSGINVKRLVIPGGYVLDTRRIRWRDNHYPSAPFRQDGLLITHLYQRTYGAVRYSVIPAIVVCKIIQAAANGEPDFPGLPTTIRRPFSSVSIWPSWPQRPAPAVRPMYNGI